MQYWLVKFAPFRYNWNDILRTGKFEIYSVRNAQARNNLKLMKAGDKVLFYESQKGCSIRGVMSVIVEAHQDPTTSNEKWLSVTFAPKESFVTPITLRQIKQEKGLQKIRLVTQPRLAVMEITEDEYHKIINLTKS